MKIFKLSMLALALAGFGVFGCGSSNPSPPNYIFPSSGGSMATDTLGAGGGGGTDSGIADSPIPTDVPPPGEAGPAAGCGDCTGLTPQQCQDCIINQVPNGVLIQDPGPNPAILYPECTAG